MNGRDLLAEMDAAASRVRLAHLERLRSLGVGYGALAKLGAEQHTVGVARIEPQSDGLFIYSDEGLPACVVAVVDQDRDLGDAGVFDLVAFATDNPARWWGRSGAASALGLHLLDGLEPVPVVGTPAEWLARAGEAVCVLDWLRGSPAWAALRSGPPLVFTDDALRVKVRNAIVQAAPMPQMELVAC